MKKGKGCLVGIAVLSVLFLIVIIIAINSGGDDEVIAPPEDPVDVAPVVMPEPEGEEPEKISETLSQKNAVRSAEQYLSFAAFSKTGLIEQLEFEGYSTDDATYAVNKLDANWKEQAVKKAEEYLDLMAFSRTGLIEQLEFEGFSREEATYAVDKVGF